AGGGGLVQVDAEARRLGDVEVPVAEDRGAGHRLVDRLGKRDGLLDPEVRDRQVEMDVGGVGGGADVAGPVPGGLDAVRLGDGGDLARLGDTADVADVAAEKSISCSTMTGRHSHLEWYSSPMASVVVVCRRMRRKLSLCSGRRQSSRKKRCAGSSSFASRAAASIGVRRSWTSWSSSTSSPREARNRSNRGGIARRYGPGSQISSAGKPGRAGWLATP